MRRSLLVVGVALLACSNSPPVVGGDASVIDASDDGGSGCELYVTTLCRDGNLQWGDSCGNVIELRQECLNQELCLDRRPMCCAAPVPSGAFTPAGFPYVIFTTFDVDAAVHEIHLEIIDAPAGTAATNFGHWISWAGTIDGKTFFFGLQTTIDDAVGTRMGPGSLFSYFDTGRSAADLETAPGGFSVIDPAFISVRKEIAWGKGNYTLRLARTTAVGGRDRFEATLVNEDTANENFLGAINVARANGGTPAVLDKGGSSLYTQFFFSANGYNYANVPKLHYRASMTADGRPFVGSTSRFDDDGEGRPFPNLDIFYDGLDQVVDISIGGDTPSCSAPGPLVEAE